MELIREMTQRDKRWEAGAHERDESDLNDLLALFEELAKHAGIQ